MSVIEKKSNTKRKILSIAVTSLMGWFCSFLSVSVFGQYQYGLFIWLPLVMGVTSTVLLGYKNPSSINDLRSTSYICLLILCLGMLITAFEGVICVVMAFPIGYFFNWLGYKIGRMMLTKGVFGSPPMMTILLIASVPILMSFEDTITIPDDLRSVTTVVEIDAIREDVWKNVVQFPQLDEPDELLFKVGIAYPINAQIKGEGVGAIRHCNFSTGSFVEPITTWDKPNLLQFSVTEQPEPMKELSLYDIHPNHLHGYWVSQKGQFKLTQMDNGHTRLEGTTWYINKIKPDVYWTIWSDFIVHKIHERVLNHIKKESEK